MLIKELEARKRQLEGYLEICESFLRNAPEGTLHISSSRGSQSYYWMKEDKARKTLLSRKDDQTLIRSLAQKEYYTKVLKDLRDELRVVSYALEREKRQFVSKAKYRLHELKRNLITPLEEPLEVRRARFEKLEAPPLVIGEDDRKDNPHVTLNGEHVRSAAEKTIANALKKAGIPYKYEYPFRTADHRTLHPDFTIFNPKTGEIIRWEHLGMMERPKYVRDTLEKMDSYYKSSLFTGNGLILTFSDSYQGIDRDLVEKIISKLFV